MAASLNSVLALSALTTASSTKEYVDMAVQLYQQQGTVLRLIRQYIGRVLGVAVFNSDRFAGHLERAYQAVYELYPSYKHVYHIEVPPST